MIDASINLPKIIKTLFRGVGVACIVAALFGVALTTAVNLQFFNAKIETTVSDLVGRDVRIHGRVGFHPLPIPAFSLEDISIKGSPGWAASHLLKIEEIECRIGLSPLLSGLLSIDKIHEEVIEIFFERNAQQQINWVEAFAPAGNAANSENAPLKEIRSASRSPLKISLHNL